jgi:uridine kinase
MGNDMNAFVAAFAGHSGAGKSTLIKELSLLTGDVNVLQIDNYDSSSYPPAVKWIEDGADPNEFQTPQFFSDILALKSGKSIFHPNTNQEVKPARFLFIEEPFGKGRQAISGLIDLAIYIDTPLEIALARRLLRMSNFISQDNSEFTIHEHLQWYLRAGRIFYMAVERIARKNCDLIVDGLLSTGELAKIVNEAIKTKLQN